MLCVAVGPVLVGLKSENKVDLTGQKTNFTGYIQSEKNMYLSSVFTPTMYSQADQGRVKKT